MRKVFAGGKGSTQALAGVDLQVPTGSAFGLVGPNGAGKTTFIKILLGISAPTAGEVTLLGSAPTDPNVRRRVGYLPERLELPASFTAAAFLKSIARFKAVPWSDTQGQALLERVGLSSVGNKRIGAFSKGMRQRVGLAGALLGQPDLLVLDEPTDGIDPLGRIEVRQVLAQEKARGATLLLNSHLLAETERVCDWVAVLNKGQVVRQGSLESLTVTRNHWRARFKTTPVQEAALHALGWVKTTLDGFRIEAASETMLNTMIDDARRTGALLVELHPEADDLEAVFQRAVEA
ncbi:MAG: ABC transporter ATP-binding protein [Myxococcaceae bacterium]|nr:ABC transporter ATP-binding protein [Myxococcaceae bacterium]